MFIVSPKWIYHNNKKLEKDKSLIIDGSFIKDIVDTKSVEKHYNDIKKVEYPNHLLTPTFTESFLNMDDCLNQTDIDRKIRILLKNGVTRLQAISKNYKKFILYNFEDNLDMSYLISFNGKDSNQSGITDMISMLDFYKSDPTKNFSLNLINILDFENSIIEKLASISNEVNISIHIQGNTLSNLKHESKINDTIKFWDSINLLNNCYLHDFFCQNENWLSLMDKKAVKLMIDYDSIDSLDRINTFSSLIERKYKCILISNRNNFFKLYNILKFINTVDLKNYEKLDRKIIDCITINASNVFPKSEYSGCIKKGLLASFNIFDYSNNKFSVKDDSHNLCYLDNQSLSNVWSAGKQVIF